MKQPLAARERLAVALDVPTLAELDAFLGRLGNTAGVGKVGLELFVAEGRAAIDAVRSAGTSVFLDLKLHDIPETVERAVARVAALDVRYCTLHASGGPTMIERAVRRAEKENPDLLLVGVTVLTSFDTAQLASIGIAATPEAHALRLAQLGAASGLRAFVCSPREVATLAAALEPGATFITPGIRPTVPGVPMDRADDQARTATASDAIHAGASIVVVGRPIRDAADPRAAAAALIEEIEEGSR